MKKIVAMILFLSALHGSTCQVFEYSVKDLGPNKEPGRQRYQAYTLTFLKPLPVTTREGELMFCDVLRGVSGVFYPEVVEADAAGVKKIAIAIRLDKNKSVPKETLQGILWAIAKALAREKAFNFTIRNTATISIAPGL